MDLLNFFFNLHQIMYSFGKQREKIWGEGHFKAIRVMSQFASSIKYYAYLLG